MSSRKSEVLVSDSFHDGTREHPAMKWMEKFREYIDTGNVEQAAHWYSPNFVYVSSDGTETSGGEKAWTKMYNEYFDFFKDWHHEPYSIVCFEADRDGCEYEMVGQAQLYANLVGDPSGDNVAKVVNPKDGKEWDIMRPGAWHFWYEKSDDPKHEGYQMARLHLMMDSGPAVARLMHRGHMSHTDLIDKHVGKQSQQRDKSHQHEP